MKLFHFFFLIALPVITTISCGSDNDDDDGNSVQREQEKNLFSRWQRVDGLFIDLRNGRFNTPFPMTFIYQSGASCQCNFVITGTQSSGEAQVSSCTYVNGGGGDPGCFQLNESASYTKDETELRVCDPRGCESYR